MKTLILAYVLAQGADVGSTCTALTRPRTHEANPLLPSTCPGIVAAKATLTVGVTWVMHKGARRHPRLVKWATIASTAVTAAAAVHNIRALRHSP